MLADVLIMLLIVCLVLGAGAWVWNVNVRAQRQLSESRNQELSDVLARRWQVQYQRFTELTDVVERHHDNPDLALEVPGWLISEHPAVQHYQARVREAHRRWHQIVGEHPSPTMPTHLDKAALDQLSALNDSLAQDFGDTDHVLRVVGWNATARQLLPATGQLHHQFRLDSRWGATVKLPRLDNAQPSRIPELLLDVVEQSWPIPRQAAVAALVPTPETVHREWNNRVQAGVDALLVSAVVHQDEQGLLWPQWVDTDQWGAFRVFGEQSELQLAETTPLEIANALWVLAEPSPPLSSPVSHEQLLTRAAELLGENDDAALRAGLYAGLSTGRLQQEPDGTITRLRTSWPASYRRPR